MNSSRIIYLSIFVVCSFLLGFGLYLEHIKGLEPCPLCIFQRVAYIAIAIVALIATIHNTYGLCVYIYITLIFITASLGVIIAVRQIWLQHLPADKVPECGPGLDYMMEVFPFSQVLKMVFSGSGECADIQWTFIYLSIPEWSIIFFSIIIAVTIYIFKMLLKLKQQNFNYN